MNLSKPTVATIFTVAAYLGKQKVAEGRGYSKKEAEQDAARNAMQKLNWL